MEGWMMKIYVDMGSTADIPSRNGGDHLDNSILVCLLETAIEGLTGGALTFIAGVDSGGIAVPNYSKSAIVHFWGIQKKLTISHQLWNRLTRIDIDELDI